MDTQQDQYDTTLTPFAEPPESGRSLHPPRKFGWGDAIAILAIVFLVVFVIYPVYRALHPDNRLRGVVVDEYRQPMPGVVLEAHDHAGRALGAATTDARGEVLWNLAWGVPGTTFGQFGVARFVHSTGGRDHVYLAPLVLHQVRVRNAITGLPQGDLSILVNPDVHSFFSDPKFQEIALRTSPRGSAEVGTFPSTARMQFYCGDSSFAVWNVVSTIIRHKEPPYQKEILYDVTVVPTGTLTGRAVYPDGTVVARGVVLATLIGSAPDGESRYLQAAIDPATKTFRMRGLLPGRWRVGYEPWYGGRDKSQGGREILIQSGETKTLIEPLRVYWTNDKR